MRPPGFALVAVAVIVPAGLPAQSPASGGHIDVPTIAARPAGVSTVDGIIAAYYDVISKPGGEPRQWSRDRTPYWPGIRFFAARVTPDGTPAVHVVSHQEYVDAVDADMVKAASRSTRSTVSAIASGTSNTS